MKKLITIILACASVNAMSQNVGVTTDSIEKQISLNTITTAVPFLVITPDARSGAIGDAGAALSPDANSLYWNTSKLVHSKEKAEFSASYSPWLRQLVDDIHLSYIAGYSKLGTGDRHVIGGSLRYFSLGNITFTDQLGNVIREFNPNEFEVLGGYAFRLSERSAIGLNGKFIYSNLTGGINVGSAGSKSGLAGAVDVSYSYFNEDISLGNTDAVFGFATSINNIGNKIAYTTDANRDFLPTNLRLGSTLKMEFDEFNSITGVLDVVKLLVPTAPVRNGNGDVISGYDNDVGVTLGMIRSFYDAPGQVSTLEDSSVVVEGRFMEELREYNFSGGLEYWYSDILAVRAGYFHEHASKGARQYLTFGAGIYYSVFGIDVSYLAAFRRTNPLANTVRFSLKFKFGGKKLNEDDGASL